MVAPRAEHIATETHMHVDKRKENYENILINLTTLTTITNKYDKIGKHK